MKYYNELTEIESQIIRLGSMSSVLRVISNGAEQSNAEDVSNALWHIDVSIKDIHDCLKARLDEVWDAIRADEVCNTVPEADDAALHLKLKETVGNKHKGDMKKKKMMTDKELP